MRRTTGERSSSSSADRSRPADGSGLAAAATSSRRPLVTQLGQAREATVESVLYLKQNQAKFSAPSKRESVFFDECNREIISLTTGIDQTPNRTRVVIQRTSEPLNKIQFILPIEKRILSIKLNTNRTVLAYHVDRNIVEFINVCESLNSSGEPTYELDTRRYVQSSRAKNSKLIGFLWIGPTELVFITDLSVEYYHLNAARCRLSLVKMFQSATNWFVYQPMAPAQSSTVEGASNVDENQHSILMVSTGSLGNLMQPYLFSSGRVVRLLKFEVEGRWTDGDKLELSERSITIAHIYGYVRLLVLQNEALNIKSRGAQIVLYTVDPESGTTSKTHTLDLDVTGRFAINILDNLVIAHDQPSKSSFLFDIMVQSTEKSDCPKHFVSLINRLPIRPFSIESGKPVEMYSLNWVFFQPNFIVDAKLGLLTELQLDLVALQKIVEDNNLLLGFLSYRKDSGAIILKKCKQIVQNSFEQLTLAPDSCSSQKRIQPTRCPLADVSSAFEILGKLMISAPDLVATPAGSADTGTAPESADSSRNVKWISSIYQEDVQREIFRALDSDETMAAEQTATLAFDAARYHFVVATLLEFIFVVRRQGKNVEFCIYEQLIRFMIRARRHFQVIQLIRGKIFADSKQLACLLLSLRDQYRPAGQLGLDMFHRLPGGLPANLPRELTQE